MASRFMNSLWTAGLRVLPSGAAAIAVVSTIGLPASLHAEEQQPMRRRMEQLVYKAQDKICAGLEGLDNVKFQQDAWTRSGGGGGRTRVIQNGVTFEKGGVNVSVIHGKMSAGAASQMRAKVKALNAPADGLPFFACGISLVIHPRNPMVPTTHANYRYFEIEADGQKVWWFGGGADLTPYYLFEEDAVHFHQVLKDACDRHDPEYYKRFKKWCDEYFYLNHRQEHRGIGGIFFDDLDSDDPDATFKFVEDCAMVFTDAYLPIVERRRDMPYNPENREWQEIRRGRYAEFNLVYDRGTKFGLQMPGSRTESIMMSLPPVAQWRYCHSPAPGTPEAKLMDVVKNPREWIPLDAKAAAAAAAKVDLSAVSTQDLARELVRRKVN